MKKRNYFIALALLTVTVSAWKIADDIITRLGMEQKFVQGNIVSNLVGRFSSSQMEDYDNADDQEVSFRLPYIPAPKLSTVISGDKAGAAKELCEYVKKYINSEEFMTEYAAQRESAMPLRDNGTSLSTLKGNKIVNQKNINNYKTDTKYVAEQQKELDETQKRIDALLEAAKKPFPGKANWEKKYPADPTALIKKRLQEYLQLAATVDFNAALTIPDKYKIKKFTNPVYEKKSNKWKAIFRAGKEVNDVLTAFVKEWLKGEIISKEKIKMADSNTEQAQNQPPQTTNTNDNNSTVTTTPAATPTTTETIKKEEPLTEKKSGLQKIRNKLGTIIKN